MNETARREPTLRTLWITAVYEFLDALRSRRALVLMLLYFLGSVAASHAFINLIGEIEKELLETLRVAETDSVGSVTETLWQTEMFKDIIVNLVRDKDLAEHIVGISPIAVFYGWLSFTFAPVLMMLISTTRVAEELGSGSARFVLFRSSLFPWVMGKYLGQALLLLPSLLLSAAGAWIIGWWKLSLFDPGSCAWQLLGFSLLAIAYTWTFLGLATGVSMMTRYPNLATVFGFAGLIILSVIGAAARHFRSEEMPQRLLDLFVWLTPGGYRTDLWWPDPAHQVPAIIMLLALGILYLLPGYVWLSRRDF